MIWLASFPRSGNTFFRNILYEVYGMESGTFHLDPDYHLDKNYEAYPFVKTHLLPSQLQPADLSVPAVYILRDGRDTMVSMAHHRKDIVAPGSDFYENLKAAIIAEKGSFFGGWSNNVLQWIKRADIVIRYEDLLVDPIQEAERLRKIIDLPAPDKAKLPEFEKLKFGIPQYGSGKDRGYTQEKMKDLAQKNFRKGKAGSWKEEMPEELFDLFWSYHGDAMEAVGYAYDGGQKKLHPELDYELLKKLGKASEKNKEPRRRILIESNKIVSPDNDGVKRYQTELLKGFLPLVENSDGLWDIDLFVHGEIFPLLHFRESLTKGFTLKEILEKRKYGNKTIFERFEQLLIKAIPLQFIQYLEKNEIKIFHKIYEFLKKGAYLVMKTMIAVVGYIKQLSFTLLRKTNHLKAVSRKENRISSYDLIHLPLMHHFEPFKWSNSKILVTVHDMTHSSFPQFHTKINISNSRKGIRFIHKSNAAVIAVSESTKNDFLKECSIGPQRMFRIYEAADRQKFNFRINSDDNKKIRKKYGIDGLGDYIVCLSTIEPRKNLENTIKGFKLLLKENPGIPLNLVIAGKKGWETTKLFLSEASAANRVFFTGFVDDEDISAIYSDAIAMSYLSFYEGFGLPPLEAMCCGTPVIYGNNSSLIEVVGNGGLPCDPYDIHDIKEKFGQICFDKKLRNQKSREALRQSHKFSWRRTVEDTLEVYKYLIDK